MRIFFFLSTPELKNSLKESISQTIHIHIHTHTHTHTHTNTHKHTQTEMSTLTTTASYDDLTAWCTDDLSTSRSGPPPRRKSPPPRRRSPSVSAKQNLKKLKRTYNFNTIVPWCYACCQAIANTHLSDNYALYQCRTSV